MNRLCINTGGTNAQTAPEANGRLAEWLRFSTENQEVAGSIPAGDMLFFSGFDIFFISSFTHFCCLSGVGK